MKIAQQCNKPQIIRWVLFRYICWVKFVKFLLKQILIFQNFQILKSNLTG